jgi:hypothetical protein
MTQRILHVPTVYIIAIVGAIGWITSAVLPAQRSQSVRTADKRPDLNGIWQTMNTAHWDLEAHSARPSLVLELGAIGGAPGGQSVVEGGTIPYHPAALEKRKQNFANRLAADPEINCFLPGIPRATYMPYPFQIVQSSHAILMAYEYAKAVRVISMDGKAPEMPVDTWMGYSTGRWDGDTLVVDTKGFNDRTWFDRAGNYHSDQLQVIERFTLSNANVLMYQATMTDPKTFSRPWTISMPLYRHVEKNAQLLEYNCVALTEEMRYGPLLKDIGK